MEYYRMTCEVRGYCGPFINQEFYNSFPDPMWHGYGECVVCCSTCIVAQEALKRTRVEGTGPRHDAAPLPTPGGRPGA